MNKKWHEINSFAGYFRETCALKNQDEKWPPNRRRRLDFCARVNFAALASVPVPVSNSITLIYSFYYYNILWNEKSNTMHNANK